MPGFLFIFYLLQMPIGDLAPLEIRIEEGSLAFGDNNVTFTASVRDAAGLNREVIAELWESDRISATGNAHTFTHVGERHTFEIGVPADTLRVGYKVGLNLTPIPGRKSSYQQAVVQVGVPALGKFGLFALIILLGGLALMQQRPS